MGNYNPSFAQEVFGKVDFGEEIKMCMQCGVCAASCPLSMEMDYPPRQVFTMIRAGKREEVLNCQSIFLCTSCYTCKVRCPRKIPVVDVMHGLAHYAIKQGMVSRKLTASFGSEFWNQVYRLGRVDEKDLPRRVFFSGGFVEGVKEFSHEYPFCWRCDSPLLYYAMESWFIGMSKIQKNLVDNNNQINWEYILIGYLLSC